MKIAEAMAPAMRLGKAKGRKRETYRAGRREAAKVTYRKAKRGRALAKRGV